LAKKGWYLKAGLHTVRLLAELPILQVKAKYMDTGSYLRPHDILYCLEKTKFSEESIISWFKRSRSALHISNPKNGKMSPCTIESF
jgi:hypothetical protein